MSKGSPSIKVRLPPATIALVKLVIAIKNEKRFERPLTVTDFVQDAIATALKEFDRHQRWNKTKRDKKKNSAPPSPAKVEHTTPSAGTSVLERQENNESNGEATGQKD
jgi:hypothetical protein